MFDIPDRFKDMSASEVFAMIQHPENTDLTFGEYYTLVKSCADIMKDVNKGEINALNNDIDRLNAKVRSLENENAKLESLLRLATSKLAEENDEDGEYDDYDIVGIW